MHLDSTKQCFVCGPDNTEGLKLEPYIDNGNVVFASYTAPDHLCGFKGFLHGGMHCALMDCMSAWASKVRGKTVATTHLNVRLLKPVLIGERMSLRSEIASEEGNDVIIKGEIRNARDELCTVSEIRARVLSDELLQKFTGGT
jgi:acyl-coenzyme A thioesterase PaaI-like protein